MKLPRRRFLRLAPCAAALAVLPRAASAQAYPTRPVRIIIGIPPGGPLDLLQAARLLVYKAATRLDKGEDAREDAYVCKYYADEMAFRAADQCMQIHGGIGLTTDLPIEKLWRQQRSYRITEGASEVMKMVIARHVLKAYG